MGMPATCPPTVFSGTTTVSASPVMPTATFASGSIASVCPSRKPLVNLGFERQRAAQRRLVHERKQLARPEAGDAIAPVDPKIQVAEPAPRQRPRRPPARRVLVEMQEGIGPGLPHPGKEVNVPRQLRID